MTLQRLIQRLTSITNSHPRHKARKLSTTGQGETLEARLLLTADGPGDDLSSAQLLSLTPGVAAEFQETIGDGDYPWADVDLYELPLNAGDTISIDVDAELLDDGSWYGGLDSHLRVFDAYGFELDANGNGQSANDDPYSYYDSYLSFTATSTGTYYIGVSEAGNEFYDPTYGGSGYGGSGYGGSGYGSYGYGGGDTDDYVLQLILSGSGGGNSAPTAINDSYNVNQGSTLTISSSGVLGNDTDPDGDALTATLATSPSNGSLNYLNYNGAFEYVPAPGFSGTDSFTYIAHDGTQNSNSATVSITVGTSEPGETISTARVVSLTSGVMSEFQEQIGDWNQPWADVDLFEIMLDAGDTVDIDVDAMYLDDGTSHSSLDSHLVLFDASGQAIIENHDALSSNDYPNSSDDPYLSFTSPTTGKYYIGVSGGDNQTYDVIYGGTYNPFGFAYAEGSYVLQLLRTGSGNASPNSVSDSYSVDENATLTVAAAGVLENDSDADGDVLTATLQASPSNGTLIYLNADGAFEYVPNSGFSGTDSFTYVANDGTDDGNTATVTITVDASGNSAPVATNDSYSVNENVTLTVAASGVLGNDTDADGDSLTAAIQTTPSNGTLTYLNADGAFEYVPMPGFSGTDSFSYTANDGTDTSNAATVTITVDASGNSVPVANNDSYSVNENATLTVAASGVLGNDTDADGDSLTAAIQTTPSNGTLTYLNTDGAFEYVPTPGFSGTDSFSYTANDGTGTSNVATVTITIDASGNSAPVATNDSYSVNENATLTVAASGVLGNDTDADGDSLTAAIQTTPSNGTLTYLNANGAFEYVPMPGFSGTDSFSYTANDGTDTSNAATVTITVVPSGNSAPVAVNDSFNVNSNSSISVVASGVLGNDMDSDGDILSASLQTGPTNGTLTYFNADGSFRYVPNAGYTGTDSFTYVANDGTEHSNTGTVSLTVSSFSNLPPTAVDDSYNVVENTTLVVGAPGLLSNDTDPNGDTLTATLQTSPSKGILSYVLADGSFEYVPNEGFVGTDTFSYTANDGHASSNTAIVTITVTPAVPPPLNEIVVDSISDNINYQDQWTTLREAIHTANSNGPERDIISFDLPTGQDVISLSSFNSLTISSDITINGPTNRELRIEIAAANTSPIRPLNVVSGDVEIRNLEISGGQIAGGDGGGIWNSANLLLENVDVTDNFTAGRGGGIFNTSDGTLSLLTTSVSNNQSNGDGGGIYSVGPLTVDRSSVVHNSGNLGGGLFVSENSAAVLSSSTVSNNAANSGGGVLVKGGLDLSFSTIAENSASSGTAGIEVIAAGNLIIGHTIVAGNSSDSDVSGLLSSSGYNIIGNAGSAAGFGQAGDLVGSAGSVVDPLLGVLQHNGGHGKTHQLLVGSPAIDAGENTFAPALDQRGAPRVLDGLDPNDAFDAVQTTDIGAFEFGAFFVNTESDEVELSEPGDGRADSSTVGDSDAVSLRAAVQELNALAGFNNPAGGTLDGTILFQPGVNPKLLNSGAQEDEAATGDLDVFGSLTLLGNGMDSTLIDGQYRTLYKRGLNAPEVDGDFNRTLSYLDPIPGDGLPDDQSLGPILGDRIFHVHPDAKLNINDLIVAGGRVIDDGDEDSDSGLGGAIFNDGGSLHTFRTLLAHNEGHSGGAVFSQGGQTTIDEDSILARNKGVLGGAIYVGVGNVAVQGRSRFDWNLATGGGGAIYSVGTLHVTDESVFEMNGGFGLGVDGGAIHVAQGTTTIDGESGFLRNALEHRYSRGGAIFNAASLVVSDGTWFKQNQSLESIGGAVFNKGNSEFTDVAFLENLGARGAGAIYNAEHGTAKLQSVLMDANWVYLHGQKTDISGHVYDVDGDFSSVNGVFQPGPVRIVNGGAIVNDNAEVTILESVIRNSTGAESGGAIYNYNTQAKLTVVDSLLEDNFAISAAGGILNDFGTVDFYNSTIDGEYFDGGISNFSENLSLGDGFANIPLSLDAAVTPWQDVVYVEDVSVLRRVPLPIDIMINEERMTIVAVDDFLDAISVQRTSRDWHDVDSEILTFVNEHQTQILVDDVSMFDGYTLPLDIVVDDEVMTITEIDDDLITVLRGRDGTLPAIHQTPSTIWARGGSLTIKGSTFHGLTGPTFNKAAVRTRVHPQVRATVIESSTFHATALGLDADRSGDAFSLPAIVVGEWPQQPKYGLEDFEHVGRNVIAPANNTKHGTSRLHVQPVSPQNWFDEYGLEPKPILFLQNTVVTDPVSEYSLNLRGALVGHVRNRFVDPLVPVETLTVNGDNRANGTIVSGGGNFIGRDEVATTRTVEPIDADSTVISVKNPDQWYHGDWVGPEDAFPKHPFLLRLTKPASSSDFAFGSEAAIDEEMYVSHVTWEVNPEFTEYVGDPEDAPRQHTWFLHVARGIRGTEPGEFDSGSVVTYSLTGFNAANDQFGVTNREYSLRAVQLVDEQGIEATTNVIQVSDPEILPEAPFQIRVRHEVLIHEQAQIYEEFIEYMHVFEVFGDRLLVGRGIDGSEAIAHPFGASIRFPAPITELDPQLSEIRNHGGLTTTIQPLPDSSVISSGDQVGFETRSTLLASGLGAQFGVSESLHLVADVEWTALTAPITANATILSLDHVAELPNAPFDARIGEETVTVTNINHTSRLVTVTRGSSGSTAVAHPAGSSFSFGGFASDSVTLTADLLPGDTQLQLDNATSLPATPFDAFLGEEYVVVTSLDRATGVAQIDRGAFGSDVQEHRAGVTLLFGNASPDVDDDVFYVGNTSWVADLPMVVRIHDELMSIVAVNSDMGLIRVQRGQFGTSAVQHAGNAVISDSYDFHLPVLFATSEDSPELFLGENITVDENVWTLDSTAGIQARDILKIGDEYVSVREVRSSTKILVRRGPITRAPWPTNDDEYDFEELRDPLSNEPYTIPSMPRARHEGQRLQLVEPIVADINQTMLVVPTTVGLPATPFIIRLDQERMRVTEIDHHRSALIVERAAFANDARIDVNDDSGSPWWLDNQPADVLDNGFEVNTGQTVQAHRFFVAPDRGTFAVVDTDSTRFPLAVRQDHLLPAVSLVSELPATASSIQLPDSSAEYNVPLMQGENVVFVVDVSGSANDQFFGATVGDQNGDGNENTILDVQIAALVGLNHSLIQQGNTANVSIVAYSDSAFSVDMNQVLADVQLSTNPGADADNDGVADVVQLLRSLSAGGNTSLSAAVREVADATKGFGASPQNGSVIFFSAGQDTATSSYGASSVSSSGISGTIHGFEFSRNAESSTLNAIDADATVVHDASELLKVFTQNPQTSGQLANILNGHQSQTVTQAAADVEFQVRVSNDGLLPVTPFLASLGDEYIEVTEKTIDADGGVVLSIRRGVYGTEIEHHEPGTTLQFGEYGHEVRMGTELLQVNSVDAKWGLTTLVRGANGSAPDRHVIGAGLLHGNKGVSDGFHGLIGQLRQTINSTQDTIHVDGLLPSLTLPIDIRVHDEMMYVTEADWLADGSVILHVNRGQYNTSAQTHVVGVNVRVLEDQSGQQRYQETTDGAGRILDAGSVEATVFHVTTTDDFTDTRPGDGIAGHHAHDGISLRAAIVEGNAQPGTTTIVLPEGIYTLTLAGAMEDLAASGDLDILKPVQLVGAGADLTTIQAGQLDRIFDVFTELRISGVTLTGGNVLGDGGAIRVSSDAFLLVDEVHFHQNTAERGGAVYSPGATEITRSTFSNNHADVFGGGLAVTDGRVFVENTTFSANHSPNGGGVYIGHDVEASVLSTTITLNTGLAGAGLYTNSKVDLGNTIIAANSGSDSALIDVSGIVESQGNNFLGVRRPADTQLTATAAPNSIKLFVSNSSNLPATPFVASLGTSELVLVTAINGNELIVQRGHADTGSGYHSPGVEIRVDGFFSPGDDSGTLASPLNPELSPLHTPSLSAVPVHVPLPASPIIDAGNDDAAYFQTVNLIHEFDGANHDLIVDEWQTLPTAPFPILIGDEVLTVLKVSGNKLSVKNRDHLWETEIQFLPLFPAGTPVTILVDAAGNTRSFDEVRGDVDGSGSGSGSSGSGGSGGYGGYGGGYGGGGYGSGSTSGANGSIDIGAFELAPEYSIEAIETQKSEETSVDGITTFQFRVTRTGYLLTNTSVGFAVAGHGDHPVDANDFSSGQIPSGLLTFAKDETEHIITVEVAQDSTLEHNEMFGVHLFDPSWGTRINVSSQFAEIVDDDTATVTLSDAEVEEGGFLVFEVTLDKSVEGGFLLPLKTAGSLTAVADVDFTTYDDVIAFAGEAGETHRIVVSTIDDSIVELDETLLLESSTPEEIATELLTRFSVDSSATGTIINNDSTTLHVESFRVLETDATSGPDDWVTVQVGVTSSNAVDASFTVVATAESIFGQQGAPATSPDDFETNQVVLSFAGGVAERQTIPVRIKADLLNEADELFAVNLTQVAAAGREPSFVISNGQITIVNDDQPRLIVQRVLTDDLEDPLDPDSGFRTVNFVVTLVKPLGGPVSVVASTANGTAIGDDTSDPANPVVGDFAHKSELLSFTGYDGETATFSVQVRVDEMVELDELFEVVLSDLDAGGQEDQYDLLHGGATIQNFDTAAIVVDNVSVSESTGEIVFTVRLDGAVDVPVVVTIAALGLEAVAGEDFPDTTEVLTFSGQRGETLTFTVPITNDARSELPQRMIASVESVVSAGRIGIDSSAVGIGTLTEPPLYGEIENEDEIPGLPCQGPWHSIGYAGPWESGYEPVPGDIYAEWQLERKAVFEWLFPWLSMPYDVWSNLPYVKFGENNQPYHDKWRGNIVVSHPDLIAPIQAVRGHDQIVSTGIDGIDYKMFGDWTLMNMTSELVPDDFWEGYEPCEGGVDDDEEVQEEEEEEIDVEDLLQDRATIATDWSLSHNDALTFTPFTSLKHRRVDAQQVTLAVTTPDGVQILAVGGGSVNLAYGTLTLHQDLSVTYLPYSSANGSSGEVPLKSRTGGENRLLPELNGDNEEIRRSAIEMFDLHVIDNVSFEDNLSLESTHPYSSLSLELPVSNNLPVLTGHSFTDFDGLALFEIEVTGILPDTTEEITQERYLPAGVLDLDAPIFADHSSTYTFDLMDLLSDPDGDEINIVGLQLVNTASNGYADSFSVPIGNIETVNNSLAVTSVSPRHLNFSYSADTTTVTLTNELSKVEAKLDANPQPGPDGTITGGGRRWIDDPQAQRLEFLVFFTDGQKDDYRHDLKKELLQPDGDDVLQALQVVVYPNVYSSASQFQTKGAPSVDPRLWLDHSKNADEVSDGDGDTSAWTLDVQPLVNGSQRTIENVGGVGVDLFNNSFQVQHGLLLDRSGGASELSLPGLIYDSSTVHVESNELTAAGLDPAKFSGTRLRTILNATAAPSEIAVELHWHGPARSTLSNYTISFNASGQVVDGSGNLLPGFDSWADGQFELDVMPQEIDEVSGVHMWDMTISIPQSTGSPLVLRESGEVPIIVGDENNPLGQGWFLDGVPSLVLDERNDNRTLNDRFLLAFPGSSTLMFDATALTAAGMNYSGPLTNMQFGSLSFGDEGFKDTTVTGTLKYQEDGNGDEVIYNDGSGLEYVFMRHEHPVSGDSVFLIDRIEQPGVDFDHIDPASGRRGVSFVWNVAPAGIAGDHPVLESIRASDGADTTFHYDTDHFVDYIKTGDRVVDFTLDSNTRQLVDITYKADADVSGSVDRKRQFLYHGVPSNTGTSDDVGVMRAAEWLDQSGSVVRRTQMITDSTTLKVDWVVVGGPSIADGDEPGPVSATDTGRIVYEIETGIAFRIENDLKEESAYLATVTVIADDLEAYNSSDGATGNSGEFISDFFLDRSGKVVRHREIFDTVLSQTDIRYNPAGLVEATSDATPDLTHAVWAAESIVAAAAAALTAASDADRPAAEAALAAAQLELSRAFVARDARTTRYWYDFHTPKHHQPPRQNGETTDSNNTDDTHSDKRVYDATDYRNNVTFIHDASGMTRFEYETDDSANVALGQLVKQIALGPVSGGNITEVITDFTRRSNDGATNTVWTVRGDRDAQVENPAYGSGGLQMPQSDVLTGQSDRYEFSTYFGNGRLATVTDARGLETSYQYDDFGRVKYVTVTDDGSGTSAGLTTTTQYVYDNNTGFVTTELSYAGGPAGESGPAAADLLSQTEYEYDHFGLLITTQTTATVVDDTGNFTTGVVNAAGFDYTVDGLVRYAYDAFGTATEYVYNIAGQLIKMTEALGEQYLAASTGSEESIEQETSYTYYTNGQLQSVDNPGASKVNYYFAPQDRKQWVETTGVALGYDAGTDSHSFGSQVSETTSDALGRIIEEKNLLTGAQTNYGYADARHDLPTSTATKINVGLGSELGVKDSVTNTMYDAQGRVQLQSPSLLASTAYDYDELGYLISQTNLAKDISETPVGGWYDYTTNGAGDVIESIEVRVTDGVRIPYLTYVAYDESGQARTVMDPLTNDGQQTSMGTGTGDDEDGASPATIAISIENGLFRTSSTDRLGVTSIKWTNGAGQSVKDQNSLGGETFYSYDANGNLSHQRFTPASEDSLKAKSQHIEYRYDQLNRSRVTVYHDTQPGSVAATVQNAPVDITFFVTTDYFVGDSWSVVQSQPAFGDGPSMGAGSVDSATQTIRDSIGNVIRTQQRSPGIGVSGSADHEATAVVNSYEYDEDELFYVVTSVQSNVRLSGENQPVSGETTLTFNLAGQVLEERGTRFSDQPSADAKSTRYFYDTAGRLLTQRNIQGFGIAYAQFDPTTGQPLFKVSGDVSTESKIGIALGRSEAYTYDSTGNLLTHRDTNLNVTSYAYDALGRPLTEKVGLDTVGDDGKPTGIHHDAVRTWNYNGPSTTYTNRESDRVVSTVDPTTGTQTETWFLGSLQVNQLSSEFYSDGRIRQTSQHGTMIPGGPLTTSSTTYEYDEIGRVAKEVQTGQYGSVDKPTTIVRTSYDQFGAPDVVEFFGPPTAASGTGRILRNIYQADNLGRIISVTNDFAADVQDQWNSGWAQDKDRHTQIQYNGDNTPRTVARYAGTTATHGNERGFSSFIWGNFGLLELTHSQSPGAAPIWKNIVTYSGTGIDEDGTNYLRPLNGNVYETKEILFDNVGTPIVTDHEHFLYDSKQRVSDTGIEDSTGAISWTAASQPLTEDEISSDYVFQDPNRIIEDPAYIYRYDKEGRLTEKSPKGSTTPQLFDGDGWFDSVAVSGSWTSETGRYGSDQLVSPTASENATAHATIEVAVQGVGDHEFWLTWRAPENGVPGAVGRVRIERYESETDQNGHQTYVKISESAHTVDFSTVPDGIVHSDGVLWHRVGIEAADDTSYFNVVVEFPDAASTGRLVFDAMKVTRASTTYQWDHKSRLVRSVTDIDSNGTSGFRIVDYRYDSMGRQIIQNERFQSSLTANSAIKETLTTYSHHGSNVAFEYDINKKITRGWTYNPADGSVLAIDESSPNGNTPVWTFADVAGTVRSLATVSSSGQWDVLQRRFSSTGRVQPFVGDGTDNEILVGAPIIWTGMQYDEVSALYVTTAGLAYDSLNGRSLVDRGGPNGYVMFGNSPTNTEKGINWEKIAGPNADGYTNSFNRFMGEEGFVRAFGAAQTAFGVMQIGVGELGVASGWFALPGAVAFLNGVDDVQSGLRTFFTGKIANSAKYDIAVAMGASENAATAIDIGIGIVGGGLDDFGRALLKNGYKEGAEGALKSSAKHAARYMSVEGGATVAAGGYGYYSSGGSWDTALKYASVGSVAGGLAASKFVKCFVTGTPVAVGLGCNSYYAAAESAGQNDKAWSGAWLAAGIATLASAQLLGDERRHKRQSNKGWLDRALGLPMAKPKVPEFDVCDLDFDDVCEELMMGAASS